MEVIHSESNESKKIRDVAKNTKSLIERMLSKKGGSATKIRSDFKAINYYIDKVVVGGSGHRHAFNGFNKATQKRLSRQVGDCRLLAKYLQKNGYNDKKDGKGKTRMKSEIYKEKLISLHNYINDIETLNNRAIPLLRLFSLNNTSISLKKQNMAQYFGIVATTADLATQGYIENYTQSGVRSVRQNTNRYFLEDKKSYFLRTLGSYTSKYYHTAQSIGYLLYRLDYGYIEKERLLEEELKNKESIQSAKVLNNK
jgi:hypothetical protein